MISYFLVFIASFILNYGVQLSYYVWKKRRNPRAFAGEKTLLQYYTGYIGDGIIVALINILIYYIIVRLGVKEGPEGVGGLGELIKRQPMGALFSLAITIDVVTHYIQGKAKMINWSMPKPFHWTFPGYWHMVSLPIQATYLLLFFRLLVENRWRIVGSWQLLMATGGVLALMAVFFVLYRIDYPPTQKTSKILR